MMLLRSLREDVTEEEKAEKDREFRVGDTNGHPNATAHEFESYIIENWMKSI